MSPAKTPRLTATAEAALAAEQEAQARMSHDTSAESQVLSVQALLRRGQRIMEPSAALEDRVMELFIKINGICDYSGMFELLKVSHRFHTLPLTHTLSLSLSL